MKTKWHVPETFTCETGNVVGRWLWKTGNTCDDVNNIARKTDNFTVADITKVVQNYSHTKPFIKTCINAPETFISCFDFKVGPPPAPTPKPVPGGAVNVSSCHDAAKAYCSTKGDYCRGCQAYGNWGDMFFVAICNKDADVCHQDIVAADGTLCACQRPEGCKDGPTCPYRPPGPAPSSPPTPAPPTPPPTPPTPVIPTPSPPTPPPTPPTPPPTPPSPKPSPPTPVPGPGKKAWNPCTATSDCCGSCTCSGSSCHPSKPGAGSCGN
jgi:hypothetical protein